VLAVAGADFAIVAGDTRMSSGFNILSRNQSKLLKLTDTTVLATGGFRGDISTLQKLLRAKLVEYEHKHGEAMKVKRKEGWRQMCEIRARPAQVWPSSGR